MFSSRSVATVARTFQHRRIQVPPAGRAVPTIEPRTVMPFSTMSKIGSGKLPGGNPLSEMVPRTMPSACSKAFGETAATSTPCAADLVLQVGYRIGRLIDRYRRANALGQGELPVVDIDRGDVEPISRAYWTVFHEPGCATADEEGHYSFAVRYDAGAYRTLAQGYAIACDLALHGAVFRCNGHPDRRAPNHPRNLENIRCRAETRKNYARFE
jgi:hypothetical protein